MLAHFSKHINNNFAFLKDKTIGIAISGGIDSVVLTHLLHKLGYSIVLVHCNFKLRNADADADETFVKQLAEQLSLSFITKAFDTEKYAKQEKLSIQLAARNLRYDWFEKLRANDEFEYILTAHHADDNLETFLINLSRGTGLDGLTGIPAINGAIIRPLLPFSRKKIEKYAKHYTIEWREDLSNVNTKYLRNKIRLEVIPILKEINPSFLKSFKNTQEHLKGSQQLIDNCIEKNKSTFITSSNGSVQKINTKKVIALSNPKAYLYEILKLYGFTEWNDVVDLLSAQSGKQIFSKTHRLIKDRSYLLLERKEEEEKRKKVFSIKDGAIFFENSEVKLEFKILNLKPETQNPKLRTQNTILVDKDKIKYPLTVRKWEKGDYFYPLGMQGKKKLSKFFKDEKMSLLDKENIWLLCSDNHIVWIIGKRLDNRFKITNNTQQILKIEIL